MIKVLPHLRGSDIHHVKRLLTPLSSRLILVIWRPFRFLGFLWRRNVRPGWQIVVLVDVCVIRFQNWQVFNIQRLVHHFRSLFKDSRFFSPLLRWRNFFWLIRVTFGFCHHLVLFVYAIIKRVFMRLCKVCLYVAETPLMPFHFWNMLQWLQYFNVLRSHRTSKLVQPPR